MFERSRSLSPSPPRSLPALLSATLLLVASTGPSAASADRLDAKSGITLVEQRVIEIADSQLLSLSPDGGSIVVTRPAGPIPTELCIHDVATLEERVCADVTDLDAGLWADSVVWAPDSQKLAFAELWPQFVVDGDLWLMDASTGELRNLLDDGYSGDIGAGEAEELDRESAVTLPMYPTFTPDGAAVTFSRRIQARDYDGVDIATVPITGGGAVPLPGSEHEGLHGEYRSMRWAPDGTALYATLVDQLASGLGLDSGIWEFEADGGDSRQLLGITDPNDWPLRIMAVSPHGERILVSDPIAAGGRGALCACSLLDGSTGAIDPIEAHQPSGRLSTPVTGAMLSPDGSLLITISGRDGKQVAVRDVAGSAETVVVNEPSSTAPSGLGGPVRTWASNDTLLINSNWNDGGTLLVIDRGS